MNFYEQNMAFLKDNARYVYDLVEQNQPVYPVEINAVEGDADNLQVINGKTRCFLHSLYDKTEELAEICYDVKVDVEKLIVFGFGLGHILPYVEQHYPALQELMIIEPSLDIFREFLRRKDLVREFGRVKNIDLALNVDKDTVFNSLSAKINSKTAFVFLPSYVSLFQEYRHELFNKTAKYVQTMGVHYTSSDAHLEKWLRNMLSNVREEFVLVDHLAADIFARYPAVIVSAGPSLNKHLKYIAELKQKAVVIAVGSAVRILNEAGIQPHFRMVVDGSPIIEELIFNDKLSAGVPLIFAGQVYEKVIRNYRGRKFLSVMATDYLMSYLYHKMQKTFKTVSSNFSVGNMALDFLCVHGCRQIILLGQDMCFYDGHVHASGMESPQYDRSLWKKYKDIYGNEVYSIPQYVVCKESFEESISFNPAVKFINATEGGLGIAGAENMKLSEVMENILTEKIAVDIAAEVENIWAEKWTVDVQAEREKVLAIMRNEIYEVQRLNDKRRRLLNKVVKNVKKGLKSSRVLLDLNYAEKAHELMQNDFYCQVMLPFLEVRYRMIMQYCQYNILDETERRIEVLQRYIEQLDIELKKVISQLEGK